jgi:Leucine-rich repeat (LRR) protein
VNGFIPDEIGQLDGLRFLYLEGAQNEEDYNDNSLQFLSGTIPPLIGELDQLLVLDLNFNELEGSLPEPLFDLTELLQLDINHNVSARTTTALVNYCQAFLTRFRLSSNLVPDWHNKSQNRKI